MPWRIHPGDELFDFAHHLGADAVAGEQQELVGCHSLPHASQLVIPEPRSELESRTTLNRLDSGSRPGMTAEGLLKPAAGIGKHGRDGPQPCHDSSHRPRPRVGGIPGRRIGADAIRAAHISIRCRARRSAFPRSPWSFILLSPILLHGETIEWHAVPIFVAVGLVFPAVLTMLTFASNRALGPVVTGALGNLSPLFSVAVAVLVLHEPLRRAAIRRARWWRCSACWPSPSRARRTCATGAPGRCCCRSARR